MKFIRNLTLLTVLTALLFACAPATDVTPAAPTSVAGEYLTTDYGDAASLRNQLAYGIMKLDGTANVVTPEQAKSLIPLWQAIIALSGDTTTAEEELTSVQDQIVTTLTPSQLQEIAAMKITNAELNTFYAEYGVVLPTPVPGVTKVPGSQSGLSQADKEATKTAAEALGTPVGTGSSTGQAAKTLLFDKTIEYLMRVSGQ